MTFGEKLNELIRSFGCTPKRLVSLSGVSGATISRYRAGAREPSPDSEIFDHIVTGLYKAAVDAGHTDVTEDQIRSSLLAVMKDTGRAYDTDSFHKNLDLLIGKLHLNTKSICAYLGMDQTRFFRIRSGQNRHTDISAFSYDIGRYIFEKLSDDNARDILSDVLGCTPSELMSEEAVCRRVSDFLTSDAYSPRAYAESFLRELDRFDIDDYIAAESMLSYSCGCDAEKEFIAASEGLSSDQSAIICTDLYSGDAGDDRMMKSLAYIISLLIRRGCHIDLVLNADNPMDEILPGLKLLMPMFMSGRISAYYLKGRRDGIYRYRLISLPDAALCCEAVTGHFNTAITRVVLSADEAAGYRRRARQILALSSPLIEIVDSRQERTKVFYDNETALGERLCVLSTPPFYTLSEPLLERILRRNSVTQEESARILKYYREERDRALRVLRHSGFVINFPDIPRERYDEKPVFLSLSGLFYDREILCTYDEYQEHVRLMREFEKEHENYRCIGDTNSPFRNIQIFMHAGQGLILSKNKTPAIHLNIKHSKLRQAFEAMLSPYGESV